jgi:hypothetical protein
MRALARSDFAPWSLSEAVVSDLVRKGAHLFDDPLDPRACAELLAEIRASRRFDESLFLSQPDATPGAAAGDLPTRLKSRLAFVERAPQIVEALWSLLGPDYSILDRSLVCELPARAVPGWLRRRCEGDPATNLTAFVQPEFRDLAYGFGVEPHQDLIVEPERPADFVTLCVYLHTVGEADAPLRLLEGSHRMGAAAFSHDLKRTGADSLRYRAGDQGEMFVTERVITGEAGLTVLWHPCALYGVPAVAGDQPRISVRLRAARGSAVAAGIDAVNATLAGPLRLADARPSRAPAERPRWGGVGA